MNPTSFQFNEMLARVEQNQSRRGKQLPELLNECCELEHDLHEQIRQELARRGWIGFHGSMAHRTHRTVGEPDWIIMADGGRTLYVECKSRTGKPSPAQLALCAWAGKLGHVIHEVRSMEEFLRIL